MGRGSVEEGLQGSPNVIRGELRTGAQEHWYLETQVALAVPGERREMTIHASSQNPSETQGVVAEVLGVPKNEVVVEVRRIGGGFGGKETQGNHVACWAALLCATGRPVKVGSTATMTCCDRKRHRFLSRYEADSTARAPPCAQGGLNSDGNGDGSLACDHGEGDAPF
jgi:xanthine dehydrogenase molybdopterin-binding subunit B